MSGLPGSYEKGAMIPLPSAWLCCQCDLVIDNPNRCPVCLGEGLLSLSAILNRGDKSPKPVDNKGDNDDETNP